MSKPARPSFRRTPSRSRTAAIDWCFIRKSKRPGAVISRSRRPAGIRSNHMFAKTPRRGFGCINIGDTNPPRRIGPIRFTRGRMAGSINKSARPDWLRRRRSVIQVVDKSPCSFSSTAMRILSRLAFVAVPVALSMLTGCQTGGGLTSRGRAYHVVAYKPHDPSSVRVKLSTGTQTVYVMEGERLLMAAQANVGRAGASTPTGHFTIINKDKTKRRVSEPDAGYPMAYWCEFAPAYGFHEGFVWSSPRTHGCVRLHREAAARLYRPVRSGTPVDIASSVPEDEKYAREVTRIDQSKDPNPPRSELMSL